MALFQVKEFDSIEKGTAFEWKFKLMSKKISELGFYDLDPNTRTLFDLVKDISQQMDSEIRGKKRLPKMEKRAVRKACEKIIRTLNISLQSFAKDIQESPQIVQSFFKKSQLPEMQVNALLYKCKKWAISTWLSLQPERFYKTTQKCIELYARDGKKLNSDFQLLTELYGVILGEPSVPQQSLTEDQALNQDLINLTLQGKYISQSLLYNTANLSYIKTRTFSQHFVDDWIRSYRLELPSKQAIQQLEEEVRVQIRSQCLYKTLLKKHAATLLNFSTIQIPSDAREYLVPIQVSLKDQNSRVTYQDYFEWDILNPLNNIEQFCEQLVKDADLDQKYYSQLCYCIRTAINAELQWKFMLMVKTYKPIHKDRESPKLNTQTTQVIKKNLPYAMDVAMVPENSLYQIPKKSNPNTSSINFGNSDLFSLFMRNIDILPAEFQEFISEHNYNKKEKQQAARDTAMMAVNPHDKEQLIENLQKANIRVQNNSYLAGVNMGQCNNTWKKLVEGMGLAETEVEVEGKKNNKSK